MATRYWLMRLQGPKDEDTLQRWYGGVEDYLDADLALTFHYRVSTTADLTNGRTDRRATYAMFSAALPQAGLPETLARFGYAQFVLDASWLHPMLREYFEAAHRFDPADARFSYSGLFRGGLETFTADLTVALQQAASACPDVLLPIRTENEAGLVMRWFHRSRTGARAALPLLRRWVRYLEPPAFYPASRLFLHVGRVESLLVKPLLQLGYHGHPLALDAADTDTLGAPHRRCPALYVPPATRTSIIPVEGVFA